MTKKGPTCEDFKNGVVISDLSEIKEVLEMYAQVSGAGLSDYSKREFLNRGNVVPGSLEVKYSPKFGSENTKQVIDFEDKDIRERTPERGGHYERFLDYHIEGGKISLIGTPFMKTNISVNKEKNGYKLRITPD